MTIFFVDLDELRQMKDNLEGFLPTYNSIMIKELKKKDRFLQRHRKQMDILTAILHAMSQKRSKF